MDGLDIPTRGELCHSASPYLEARSWNWAACSLQMLGIIFWCSQEDFAYIGQANFRFPKVTSFPQSFCLHLSTCQSLGQEERSQTCFTIASQFLTVLSLMLDQAQWLSVHFLKESFTQFGLSCLFLGGLHNQLPLEDLKQTREISWSPFKGLVCQESAASLRSCVHRELGKPSPCPQGGSLGTWSKFCGLSVGICAAKCHWVKDDAVWYTSNFFSPGLHDLQPEPETPPSTPHFCWCVTLDAPMGLKALQCKHRSCGEVSPVACVLRRSSASLQLWWQWWQLLWSRNLPLFPAYTAAEHPRSQGDARTSS